MIASGSIPLLLRLAKEESVTTVQVSIRSGCGHQVYLDRPFWGSETEKVVAFAGNPGGWWYMGNLMHKIGVRAHTPL